MRRKMEGNDLTHKTNRGDYDRYSWCSHTIADYNTGFWLMVVAEVLTGLALVRSGVDFIKSNINTAKDIGEMADAIDNLFDGRDQANAAKRKASKTHSHKSVAHEVIDAKLAEEELDTMRQLIDQRFGHGTWASIVTLRAQRIHEQKEAERAERLAKKKRREQIIHDVEIGAGVIFCICALGAALIAMIMFM